MQRTRNGYPVSEMNWQDFFVKVATALLFVCLVAEPTTRRGEAKSGKMRFDGILLKKYVQVNSQEIMHTIKQYDKF